MTASKGGSETTARSKAGWLVSHGKALFSQKRIDCTVRLGNIFNNSKRQAILVDIWVGLLDGVGLGLRSNGGDDGVAAGQEGFQDMGSDEAAPTCWAVSLESLAREYSEIYR